MVFFVFKDMMSFPFKTVTRNIFSRKKNNTCMLTFKLRSRSPKPRLLGMSQGHNKTLLFRPPLGLPKSVLISGVVIMLNTAYNVIRNHSGLVKDAPSGVVLILSGLNSKLLLYIYGKNHATVSKNIVQTRNCHTNTHADLENVATKT